MRGSFASGLDLTLNPHALLSALLVLATVLVAPRATALSFYEEVHDDVSGPALDIGDNAWSNGPRARPSFEERDLLRVAALEPGVVLYGPLFELREPEGRPDADILAGAFWLGAFVALVAGTAIRLELEEKRRAKLRRRLVEIFGA
jgi:hypothetical protein